VFNPDNRYILPRDLLNDMKNLFCLLFRQPARYLIEQYETWLGG